jgi:hypothetical protein
MGRDTLEPLRINSVTFTSKQLLDYLHTDGAFGRTILKAYKVWLSSRTPDWYVPEDYAQQWREYKFRKAISILNELSEIMVDNLEK